MTWNFGPERAAAIRALEEQIREARSRLETIGATADAPETSFERRDAADIEYGELKRDVDCMDRVIEKLSDQDSSNDLATMEEALRLLRADTGA